MRLIDRDAIHWRPDENWELHATAEDIRAIPIVDAVAVTRCEKCKHRVYKYINAEIGEVGGCWLFNRVTSNDDFCSYGEPKDEPHADDHD